ncbi:MAG: glycosyltransferase family 4 protein, partial [Sulfitobacter sp.]
IFYLTRRDAEALKPAAPPDQKLIHLRPFLPLSDLPAASTQLGPMLSVGMMRSGEKLASYQIIADTLALLDGADWHLDIVGDGAERETVGAMMAPFGEKVRFLGQCDAKQLQSLYAHASLLFWPGVNEAFGLTYLEAQAAGLPVVAQSRPGVGDVLAPGDYPRVTDGPSALASMLKHLLTDPMSRARRGKDARRYVGEYHLMASASATLHAAITGVAR